jgi:hypothetical protein
MNGVSSGRIFSWGLKSPSQVLNLNQGVPACRPVGLYVRREVSAF